MQPFVNSVYTGRVVGAALLLYLCYRFIMLNKWSICSTLFIYAPLSSIFGPLLVRVKLMILRDFTNFLILTSLVMARFFFLKENNLSVVPWLFTRFCTQTDRRVCPQL